MSRYYLPLLPPVPLNLLPYLDFYSWHVYCNFYIGMAIFLSIISSFLCFFFAAWVIFKVVLQGSPSKSSSETSEMERDKKKGDIILIKAFMLFVAAVLSMILWRKFVVSFFLLIACFIGPKVIEKLKIKRRLKLFSSQLADGLTIIANSLNSGFSLQQSVDTMVKQMPPPISYEFLLALREYRLGKPIEAALADMQKRVPSEDLHLIVTAISLSRETGGNLSKVLESIANMIREKMRIEGKVEALTSNGKLQGLIIGLLPFAIGVAMYIINPDLIAPIYKTQIGWALIGVMAILETLGLIVIRRMVSIEF